MSQKNYLQFSEIKENLAEMHQSYNAEKKDVLLL